MLIGLLIFFLFGSSSGMVADLAKPVKQVIAESARAKQIIAINEAMQEEEAEFAKALKKAKKKLSKLNRNRFATEAEFEEIFSTLDQQRSETLNSLVNDRFQMKDLMTAAEWDQVHSLASD